MEESPSRLWYVAYVFLWVPAGIACYFAWRSRDMEEAKEAVLVFDVDWCLVLVRPGVPVGAGTIPVGTDIRVAAGAF